MHTRIHPSGMQLLLQAPNYVVRNRQQGTVVTAASQLLVTVDVSHGLAAVDVLDTDDVCSSGMTTDCYSKLDSCCLVYSDCHQ